MKAHLRNGVLLLCLFLVIAIANWDGLIKPFLRNVYYAKLLGTPIIKVLPRVEVDCAGAAGPGVMVALTLGQSNAANFGTPRFTPESGVYNVHLGRCYEALDPMIGTSGDGGSVWSRLGQLLVQESRYNKVFFIPIAQTSSSISQWVSGGQYTGKLAVALNAARNADIKITHVFWHQGETDAMKRTSRTEYANKLGLLISGLRERGIDAPVFVSIASYCRGSSSTGVQDAQRSVVDPENGVFLGPDTDSIVSSQYRRDDCHFSEFGLMTFAKMWVAAIAGAQRYMDGAAAPVDRH